MWILGTFLAQTLQLLTLPFDFAMNTIDWKSQVRKCRFFQFDILEFDFWSDRDWSVWKLQILSQFGIKERCEYCRHHRCFLKTTTILYTGLIRTTESCYSYQFVRFFFSSKWVTFSLGKNSSQNYIQNNLAKYHKSHQKIREMIFVFFEFDFTF